MTDPPIENPVESAMNELLDHNADLRKQVDELEAKQIKVRIAVEKEIECRLTELQELPAWDEHSSAERKQTAYIGDRIRALRLILNCLPSPKR